VAQHGEPILIADAAASTDMMTQGLQPRLTGRWRWKFPRLVVARKPAATREAAESRFSAMSNDPVG